MNGVSGDRGLEAWRRLVRQYEKKVEDKAIQAQVDLVRMAGRRARDERELKRMVVELDEKRKMAEEVAKVEETQLKTVLVMMLDDETRKHTVGAQRRGYKELRAAVDGFLSAVNVGEVEVGTRKRDVAKVGEIGDPWKVEIGDWGGEDMAWGKGWDQEALNALTKGGGKGGGKSCYHCGEKGRFARECPGKGKGKGKGGREKLLRMWGGRSFC